MKILNINSSAKINGSRSRELTTLLANQLQSISDGEIIHRDLTQDLEFITEAMIDRYYVPEEQLSDTDQQILAPSNQLVDELLASDVIVIGAPMYNFSITGMLKSYLDQICRLGKTFATNPQGFEGLLTDKIAYVIITTGGTPIGGKDDFMTNYLIRVFDFIGITDVRFLGVDKLDADEAKQQMQTVIEQIKAIELPL